MLRVSYYFSSQRREASRRNDAILGIVTTGRNWKLFTLQDNRVLIDFEKYLIGVGDKNILGIFKAVVKGIFLKKG